MTSSSPRRSSSSAKASARSSWDTRARRSAQIGTQARGGISDLLQRPAHLKLHVKVHPGLDHVAGRARALRIRAVSRLTAADSSLPLVALLGRPNVGKSSLFNRLVGGQPALVEDEPGITRDRRYGVCEWGPARFRVVDTGGLDPLATGILAAMRQQTLRALDEADVVVFVVDAREGVTAVDARSPSCCTRRASRCWSPRTRPTTRVGPRPARHFRSASPRSTRCPRATGAA